MSTNLKASIGCLNGRYVLEFDQNRTEHRYIVRNIAFFHEDVLVKTSCLDSALAFAVDRKSCILDVTASEVSEANRVIIYLKDFDSGKCFELELTRDTQGWTAVY